MKKIICLILCIVIMTSITGCESKREKEVKEHREELSQLEEKADKVQREADELEALVDEYNSLK